MAPISTEFINVSMIADSIISTFFSCAAHREFNSITPLKSPGDCVTQMVDGRGGGSIECCYICLSNG